MVRRGLAMLWRAVDVLVTNREVRGTEAEHDEYDAVEQWLKHQKEERLSKEKSNMPSITITPDRKSKNKLGQRKRKDVIPAVRAPLPPVPRDNNKRAQKAGTLVPRAAAHRSSAVKRTEWSRPPLLYRGGAGASSERFMDRTFMQQMQTRLLDQHEETLRRRIRQRQADEAQRERQLILAGIIAPNNTTMNSPTAVNTSTKRPAITKLPRSARRSPRPKTARRGPNQCSRPQSCKKGDEADPHGLADELDEAAECTPAPPRPDPRPRLALLMQACRAVIGATGPELPPLPQRRGPGEGEESDELSLLRLKYESPLIAQLREVESVDELYSLAELIVSNTKHA